MPLRCSALLAQLREGALDLVSALVEPDGLDGVRLLDAELVIVAALSHPLARAKRVRGDGWPTSH